MDHESPNPQATDPPMNPGPRAGVTPGTPCSPCRSAASGVGVQRGECNRDTGGADSSEVNVALRLAEALDRAHAQHQHAIDRVLGKVSAIASFCDLLTAETDDLRRDPRVSRAQRERSQSVVDAVQSMVLDILDEHGFKRMSVAPGERVDLSRHEVIGRVPAGRVLPGCIDRVHQLGFESLKSSKVLRKSLVTAAVGLPGARCP